MIKLGYAALTMAGIFGMLCLNAKASTAPGTCPDGSPIPVTTPGPSVAPLSLRDVQAIRIRTRGGRRAYDDVIERLDGSWVRRDDGYRIFPPDLAALLAALSSPPATQLDFSRTGIDMPYMLSALDTAEESLGASRSLPAARKAFEREFLDLPSLADSMSKNFDPCSLVTLTDYNGELDVTILSRNRRIEVTSRSWKPFMLPLWITDERGTRPTYDAALSRAIARLMPQDAVGKAMLSNDGGLAGFGDAIAQSKPVTGAIAQTGTTQAQAQRIARSMGLSLEYHLSPGGASWTGAVWLPRMPRIRYILGAARSSNYAFSASLQPARSALNALLNARWFLDAMRRTPSATAQLSDAEKWPASYVHQLYIAGRIGPADCLAGATLPRTVVDVDGGSGDSSRWFILEGGDMLLYDFSKGTAAFHFGQSWYARLPVVMPQGNRTITAAIVTREGSLLAPQASAC